MARSRPWMMPALFICDYPLCFAHRNRIAQIHYVPRKASARKDRNYCRPAPGEKHSRCQRAHYKMRMREARQASARPYPCATEGCPNMLQPTLRPGKPRQFCDGCSAERSSAAGRAARLAQARADAEAAAAAEAEAEKRFKAAVNALVRPEMRDRTDGDKEAWMNSPDGEKWLQSHRQERDAAQKAQALHRQAQRRAQAAAGALAALRPPTPPLFAARLALDPAQARMEQARQDLRAAQRELHAAKEAVAIAEQVLRAHETGRVTVGNGVRDAEQALASIEAELREVNDRLRSNDVSEDERRGLAGVSARGMIERDAAQGLLDRHRQEADAAAQAHEQQVQPLRERLLQARQEEQAASGRVQADEAELESAAAALEAAQLEHEAEEAQSERPRKVKALRERRRRAVKALEKAQGRRDYAREHLERVRAFIEESDAKAANSPAASPDHPAHAAFVRAISEQRDPIVRTLRDLEQQIAWAQRDIDDARRRIDAADEESHDLKGAAAAP